MTYSPRDNSESWLRAEALFRNLPLGVQTWLRVQANQTILGMLDKEISKYKGKMGTPPIYFPPDLGIPETFVIVRNPKNERDVYQNGPRVGGSALPSRPVG